MPDVAWTLAAVIVGGFVSFLGAFAIDAIKSRRERHQSEYDRMRDNLYALQDEIAELFGCYVAEIFVVRDPDSREYREFLVGTNVIRTKVNMISIRIGDGILGVLVRQVDEGLMTTAYAKTADEKREIYKEVLDHRMGKVSIRMEQLLHQGERVQHRRPNIDDDVN